jgi:hypothetical protein
VRAEAARRGFVGSRDELQELGQTLLDELGALLFSERALDAAGVAPGGEAGRVGRGFGIQRC